MGFIPLEERILTNRGKYFIGGGLLPVQNHQAEDELMSLQKELGALVNQQRDLNRPNDYNGKRNKKIIIKKEV